MAALTLHVSALINPSASPAQKERAMAAIRLAGGLVADGAIAVFATETFYGLAACPTDAAAVARLATLKGRDKDKPVALIASHIAALEGVACVPQALAGLAKQFWPGPLTLLLPAQKALCHPIVVPSAQGPKVGVRVSSHPVACGLAQAAGGLITATSANLSGQPAVDAIEALEPSLARQVDVILDAGRVHGEAPSSVVGLGLEGLVHVRRGAIAQRLLDDAYAKSCGERG